VQWLHAPAMVLSLVEGAQPPPVGRSCRLALISGRRGSAALPTQGILPACRRDWRAFTLLEMMMVVTIVGLIAALTLPHVRGFGQANAMSSATRQLLDDVALARQRAMVNRSTVYMVFVPPMFWTNTAYGNVAPNRQETNLMMHQYAAYALISLGAVGDQPGQHFPRYVTDWRSLPEGVFFAPFEFNLTNNPNFWTNILTTNTLSGIIISNRIYGWNTAIVPFPSLPTSINPSNAANVPLPCIAFSPQGGLATPYTNQYIVLARGSIFYPTDTNGAPVFEGPNVVETPPGNDVNNPSYIQIDWMTARATLVQNQLQ
jgi:prepilin-type N-terminal cleavage/methylation domain-containing protein